MREIMKRLSSLEAMPKPDKYADIKRLISERAYYDELTEAQKQRYYEYAQSDRRTDYEAALISILGDTHIWLMPVNGNFDEMIDDINGFAKERINAE